jgi:hypothetical protein
MLSRPGGISALQELAWPRKHADGKDGPLERECTRDHVASLTRLPFHVIVSAIAGCKPGYSPAIRGNSHERTFQPPERLAA